MYCPMCGNDIFDHSSICTHCGSIINLPASLTEAEIKRLRNQFRESTGARQDFDAALKKMEIASNYVPALYASRVFAFIVDWGLIIGTGIYLADEFRETAELVYLLLPMGAFLYFSFLTAIFGRTLGKFLVGIKVIGSKGMHPPELITSMGRTLACLVSFSFLLAGFLAPFFDAKQRAWHDILAGTRVIYQR